MASTFILEKMMQFLYKKTPTDYSVGAFVILPFL